MLTFSQISSDGEQPWLFDRMLHFTFFPSRSLQDLQDFVDDFR